MGIERVKLIIQTQDANPAIISGEVPRYTGIVNCFSRVSSEQGVAAFWRGNFTNCLRYFPTQAFNLAFKDSIKGCFPKYSPKKEFRQFFGVNLASGGLAGAGSLCIVYPLDYARTRLDCKWSPRRKSRTASTREPPTASPRSAPRKASPPSSRVPVPTSSVVLVPPWSLSSTARPRTPSTLKYNIRSATTYWGALVTFFNKDERATRKRK